MKKNKISLTEATMLALQGKLNLNESVDVSIQDDGLTMVDTDDKIITVQNKDTLPAEEITDVVVSDEIPVETVEEVPEEVVEPCEDETCEDVVEVPVEGEETIIPEQEVPEEVVEDILDESKEVKAETKLQESGVDVALEALKSYMEDGQEEIDQDWLCNDIELNIRNTESLMKAINDSKRPAHSIAYDGLLYTLSNRVGGNVSSKQVKSAFDKLNLDFKEVLKPVVEEVEELRKEDKEENNLKESKEVKTESTEPSTIDRIIESCEQDYLDWETVARECLISMSEDDAKDMVRINEWILVGDNFDEEEDLDESKSCKENCENKKKKEEQLKFSSKTFNETLTRFYKSQYSVVESFKLTKLLHSNNSLKIEGIVSNTDGLQKEVTLNFNKVQEGKSFVKYGLKQEGKTLVKENKSNVNMMTSINDGVIKCKYLITK